MADSGTNQPLPAPAVPLIPPRLLARRRFIAVAGATVFAGGVTGLAWAKTLHDKTEGGTIPDVAANPTTTAASNSTVAPGVETTVGPQVLPPRLWWQQGRQLNGCCECRNTAPVTGTQPRPLPLRPAVQQLRQSPPPRPLPRLSRGQCWQN